MSGGIQNISSGGVGGRRNINGPVPHPGGGRYVSSLTKKTPSGTSWCAKFPGSNSTADLSVSFRDHVLKFIGALETAGAAVKISATYRPPERAYLMHWCCMIAGYTDKKGKLVSIEPSSAGVMTGVDIDWTHNGDTNAARSAAKQMVAAYGIAYPAALVSRHTQRLAIDMTISWNGTLTVSDAEDKAHKITTLPANGSNSALIEVGRSYGVIKLPSDPPHWSSDGR